MSVCWKIGKGRDVASVGEAFEGWTYGRVGLADEERVEGKEEEW